MNSSSRLSCINCLMKSWANYLSGGGADLSYGAHAHTLMEMAIEELKAYGCPDDGNTADKGSLECPDCGYPNNGHLDKSEDKNRYPVA